MTWENLKWLLEVVGVPFTIVAVVGWAAWKMLGKKDVLIAELTTDLKNLDIKHEKAMLDKSNAYALVLGEKEAEIKRLNDARLDDSLKHGERMLEASKHSSELVGETNSTLNTLIERIKEWREAATAAAVR